MLIFNGKKQLPINYFPDKTLLLDGKEFFNIDNFNSLNKNIATITWQFENNEELVALIFYVKHLQSKGFKEIHLEMPYIPNARQDRVKNQEDIFTLKYFADIINSLNFKTVKVLDPHSYVSEALINNIQILTPEKYIKNFIEHIYKNYNISNDNLTLFFPDEGAMKRYSSLNFNLPYTFGIKQRDWSTGKILGLEISGNTTEFVNNKNILIIDDICSKGGTFYHSAKKLKELGAKEIFLFVTHCEQSIFSGELLKDNGLITKIYTTNSLLREENSKIYTENIMRY